MKNPKFLKVHPVADRKFVAEFDPSTDKADRWIFDRVLSNPKHRPIKLNVKHPSPNSKLSHINYNADVTNTLPKTEQKHQSPKTFREFSLNRE